MFTEIQISFLARMRVARLATADAAAQPHSVPIVFAADKSALYTPIDGKPKRSSGGQLKRLRNLAENPRVAVIVDHYEEDWTKLGWLLIVGRGTLTERGERYAAGRRLLEEKYPQYQTMRLDGRPLIVITPDRVSVWGSIA